MAPDLSSLPSGWKANYRKADAGAVQGVYLEQPDVVGLLQFHQHDPAAGPHWRIMALYDYATDRWVASVDAGELPPVVPAECRRVRNDVLQAWYIAGELPAKAVAAEFVFAQMRAAAGVD